MLTPEFRQGQPVTVINHPIESIGELSRAALSHEIDFSDSKLP
jgi:hypothetical protein